MIRRSTVFMIMILAAVVGFYFYFNNTKEKQANAELTTTPEAIVSYLFDAAEGLPMSLHIQSKDGGIVEVARDASGAWELIKPEKAKADAGLVEAASSQLTSIRVISEIPDLHPNDVGLQDPEYTIEIKLTSGVQRKAEIGVVTPTGSGYYVRTEDGRIVVVSKDAIDALLNLLTSPPYAETPTPSSVPTDTPPPATPTVVTPESATPTSTP